MIFISDSFLLTGSLHYRGFPPSLCCYDALNLAYDAVCACIAFERCNHKILQSILWVCGKLGDKLRCCSSCAYVSLYCV